MRGRGAGEPGPGFRAGGEAKRRRPIPALPLPPDNPFFELNPPCFEPEKTQPGLPKKLAKQLLPSSIPHRRPPRPHWSLRSERSRARVCPSPTGANKIGGKIKRTKSVDNHETSYAVRDIKWVKWASGGTRLCYMRGRHTTVGEGTNSYSDWTRGRIL